jgi:hypothetical protein
MFFPTPLITVPWWVGLSSTRATSAPESGFSSGHGRLLHRHKQLENVRRILLQGCAPKALIR